MKLTQLLIKHVGYLGFGILAVFATNLYSDTTTPKIENGAVSFTLPAGTELNEYSWLEQSRDMIYWEPVARDYGFDWENTFPHKVDISGDSGSQVFTRVIDGETVYFRMAAASAPALTNREVVSRFLQQSTFGPTRAMINSFPGIDSGNGFNDPPYTYFEQWIDQQIAIPLFSLRKFFRERSDPNFVNNPSSTTYQVGHNPAYGEQLTYRDWNSERGYFNNYAPEEDSAAAGRPPLDETFPAVETKRIVWYQAAITAPDALRQRIAWALSQLFVLGESGSNQTNLSERYLSYYDIFVRNAFGNIRDILGEVTYHPSMGYYLTYVDNKKADPASGTFPDENYAREVMQLFTIGLWMMEQDGSLILDDEGNPVPTYDNEDVEEFAKIFTGLRKIGINNNIEHSSGNYVEPMYMQFSSHDVSSKTLLDGSILTAPTSATEAKIEINEFLDHLFDHSNAAPFVSRFLIQRLTVSNPSPNYIADVSESFRTGYFNGNGSGIRGDLEVVIKAILLHPEARASALAMDDSHGKLREPIIRFLHYARAFEITSPQTYGFFPFYELDEAFKQSPFDSPSVFNFYQVEYQPLGEILDRGIYSPEFQIHTDQTALGLANGIHTLIHEGITDSIGRRSWSQGDLDLSYEINIADDIDGLIGHLDMMLTAGRLTNSNRSVIADSLSGMPVGSIEERKARVRKALYLFCLLPEFNVIY